MFWNKQLISKDNSKTGIISEEKLTEDQWQIPDTFTLIAPEYNSVENFIRNNYSIYDSTVTLLSPELFNYFDLDCSVVIQDAHGIAGTCFVILYDLSIFGNSIKAGHTTYLCIRKDLTKSGLAACLIRKVITNSNVRGCYVGYHQINKPIGLNSFPIQSWWFPIKPKMVSQLGFKLPIKGSHEQIRKYFTFPKLSGIQIENFSEKYIEFAYQEWSKFSVKVDWKTFLNLCFDCPKGVTKIVLLNNQPISLICYREWNIWFRTARKEVPITNFVFFTNFSGEILQELNLTTSLAYFLELGNLTRDILLKYRLIPNEIQYLNWYNWSGLIKASEVLLPFF